MTKLGLILGASGSGKSTFMRKLIQQRDRMFDIKFKRILYCYSEIAAVKPEIPGVEYKHGLPSNDDYSSDMLIILDDLMDSAYSSASVSEVFTKKSHHLSISVILVTQNLFQSSKQSRTIALNAKYLVVFKNIRDRMQIKHLCRQIAVGNASSTQIYNAYINATSKPFSHFIFDLTPNQYDFLRLRTDIFNENHSGVCFANISSSDLQDEEERIKPETFEGSTIYALRI